MGDLGRLLGSSSRGNLRAPSESEQLQGLLGSGQVPLAQIVEMLSQAQTQNAPPSWLTAPLIRMPGLMQLLGVPPR